MIICGGINIAGPEIEGVAGEHPAWLKVAVVASPTSCAEWFQGLRRGSSLVHRFLKIEKGTAGVVQVNCPIQIPRKLEFVRGTAQDQLPVKFGGRNCGRLSFRYDGSQWLRLNKRYWMDGAFAMGRFSMLRRGDKIAVAVSGGKDSLSLLHGLVAYRKRTPSPTTSSPLPWSRENSNSPSALLKTRFAPGREWILARRHGDVKSDCGERSAWV